MIIKEIENLILTEKNEKGFVYPLYNSYCLIKIPEFTLSFFNIKSKNEKKWK
ncbi:MAG: hypothetical protein QW647_06525 [Candidatus Bathyarchaeia archaeon]